MVDWRHGDEIMSDLADEVERLAHQQLPVELDPFDAAVARSRRDIAVRMRAADAKRAATFKKVIKPGDPPIGRIWPRDDYQAEREAVFLTARREGASTDEAARTLAAWERTYSPPVQPERGVRVGPVRVAAEPDGLRFTSVEREPKGPLGLRWRLWWMRRRLWWMRARLDGGPARTLGTAGATAALGSTLAVGVMALVDAPHPAVGWAYAPVSTLLVWAGHRGWRTPTVDKLIREAG